VNRQAHDTAPAIAEMLLRRVLARSGSERVRMAARMFVTAKTLAASRVRAQGVSDAVESTLAVLAQLHGTDLTPAQYAAIRARFDARRPGAR
jgi:hypothetical protein